MLRKALIGIIVLVLVVVAGLAFWTRAVLGSETVRSALASQISSAIGQPVAIGRVDASIYPRITVNLGEVTIGEPAAITARQLHVGTDLRALLSRRIEHARLRLDGARLELPLPPFSLGAASTGDAAGRPAVELVSVEEIVLTDLEVVSSGRSLRGDVEVVPEAGGLTVRRVALAADGTTLDVTGRIADISGPAGELHVRAGQLDIDQLLAFVQEFSAGAGLGSGGGSAAPPPADAASRAGGLDLVIALDADGASMGPVRVRPLAARLHARDSEAALEPLRFGLFSGGYDGALRVALGQAAPAFRWNAALSGVDLGEVMRFAGRPDTMTGTLSGRIDLAGQGADTAAAMQDARGTARVEIADGIIRNLGLVRTIVTATSMRADAAEAGAGGSRDEPFRRLSATLAIAGGAARSNDVLFESDNLRLIAAGVVRLDGSALDLKGQVQLSEALTARAGRDLVRHTSQDGRVTLPVTIAGSAAQPQVRVDVADLMKRAIRNRANEEVEKTIKKGLGDLLKRR